MSQMGLWPDPYKGGSWMALNGGGSFLVWSAAAVSPTWLQALRHGILTPLELWIVYVGFEKADQRSYENIEKLLVAMLLIGCLPSLMQGGISVFYIFSNWVPELLDRCDACHDDHGRYQSVNRKVFQTHRKFKRRSTSRRSP